MAAERSKKKTPAGSLMPALRLLLLAFVGLVFLAAGTVLGFIASVLKDQRVLSYDDIKQAIAPEAFSSFAYYRDGTLIGRLPGAEYLQYVTLDQISPYVIQALISTEDKGFYRHPGVSLRGTMRAILQQITGSDVQTGGSTLTQQLVKQTLLEDLYREELSGKVKGDALKRLKYRRKLNEILLALRVERVLTKDQILEAYLNRVYFGKSKDGTNLYGIQAAAKGYFGIDAKDLNLAQAAYLVGMLQGPAKYLPYNDETYRDGLERMKLVLGEMEKDGKITPAERETALAFDIRAHLVQRSDTAYARSPYLLYAIIDAAAEALAEDDLRAQGIDPDRRDDPDVRPLWQELLEKRERDVLTKGYHITTTIDKTLFDAFEAIARDDNNFWTNPPAYTAANGKRVDHPVQQVGAVLIDNRTGAILAFIGGRDFKKSKINFAFEPRSPGSAAKPVLAYAPALEEGVLLSPDVFVDDAPIVLADGGKEFAPANYDRRFHGLVPARQALAQSYNIPAIKLSLAVGLPKVIDYGRRMGLQHLVPGDEHSATAAIGGLTHGTSVAELTQAYSVFPNGGKLIPSYMIERIADGQGRTIYQHERREIPVLSEETAYLMNDMLTSVMTSGTGASIRQAMERAHGRRALAGKTGTSDNYEDIWFVGYTPTLTLGVWTGFEVKGMKLGGYPPKNARTLWPILMNKVLELKPELSPKDAAFPKAKEIVQMSACVVSGKLPTDACREGGWVKTIAFNKKYLPTVPDDRVQKARIVVVNGKNYIALDSTPDDLVLKKVLIKRDPIRIPKNPRPGVSYTVPDADLTLPTELDPRKLLPDPPSAPKGLTASYDDATRTVTLSWQPNPEGDIAGYRIYRRTLTGMEHVGSVMSHLPTTFSESLGDPFVVYTVTAVDIGGRESPPAQDVSPFGAPADVRKAPSPPKGLKAVRTDTGVVLTWDPNPERERVERYHIYYAPDKEGPFERIGTTDTPYFEVLTFADDGYYAVSAENALGESDRSIAVQPKPKNGQAPPPSPVLPGDQNGAGEGGGNGTDGTGAPANESPPKNDKGPTGLISPDGGVTASPVGSVPLSTPMDKKKKKESPDRP
ncbi:MAG: transglycosylase domain-containing protein [Hydrogenibacillus schlegelii]|uniref:Transglycosylase domain-containing protein n=1 Tax=Hydrogenibacillus schlegelii TaxID=1484 RepID=A0A947CXU7_HYDSH|nr:transglycosylase domain-containing protein [Hydrogenibacillus schlegelii]